MLVLEPVAEAQNASAAVQVQRQAGPARRILVVDDLSASRMVLSQQLEFLGHRVLAVDSGQAALEAWQAERFDVLLSDCNMPGMSGCALTRTIRQREAQLLRPPIPIVGCTANAMKEERARCLDAGMDELLVKPVSLDRLSALIDALAPPCSFRIEALQQMTQANNAVMLRMLEELQKNLQDEQGQLAEAVAHLDWERIRASLHRLEGVACLVDALGLARACSDLGMARHGQQPETTQQAWSTLQRVLLQLQGDVGAELFRIRPAL
ncbi:Virulence sensor protein BvgS precursor [compost metagenome]